MMRTRRRARSYIDRAISIVDGERLTGVTVQNE
jgi:hypothetical protein